MWSSDHLKFLMWGDKRYVSKNKFRVNWVNDFWLQLKKNRQLVRDEKISLCRNYNALFFSFFFNGSLQKKVSLTCQDHDTLQTRYPLWSTFRLSVLECGTLLTRYLLWSTVRLSVLECGTLLTCYPL